RRTGRRWVRPASVWHPQSFADFWFNDYPEESSNVLAIALKPDRSLVGVARHW
ncbi:MAG: hypothetical protein ACI9PP_002336, partial [Halobacteriales archaeon]